MTNVAIIPLQTGPSSHAYRAVAGRKYAQGKTAGEALDAITAQLSEEESGTLVIIQHFRPDQFFTETQQVRLKELIARWQTARDQGNTLSVNEQAELEALMEAELHASAARVGEWADAVGR
jgi:hypothetical protein